MRNSVKSDVLRQNTHSFESRLERKTSCWKIFLLSKYFEALNFQLNIFRCSLPLQRRDPPRPQGLG